MDTFEQRTTETSYDEKVIQISRVSKKTKGGNKMGFSVLMVVGDKKGKVGVGLGKAGDVISAMKKGAKKAKKSMIKVPMDGTTIPFSVMTKLGAGRVMLKPAPRGSGVIAGGPVRAVVEAAGIRDISSKIMGSDNQSSSVYATFEALRQISQLVQIKGLSLRSISDVEAEEAKKHEEQQQKAKATSQADNKDKSAVKKVAKSVKPKAEVKAAKVEEKPAKVAAKVEPKAEAKAEPKKEAAAKPVKKVAKPAAKKVKKAE